MAAKRKQGAGTVRLRADGRWEGRIVVGHDENGKSKTKNVLAHSKQECIEKLNALKQTHGIHTGHISASMPFGEWISYWYNTFAKIHIRETTQDTYKQMIYNHIIPSIGNIPLYKLTQSDLQNFYTQLKNKGRLRYADTLGAGLSDRMVRSCHAMCRASLERAVEDRLILKNPATGCKLPPKKGAEMQILSSDEIQRFLIQSKEDDFFEIAVLELATGMRRGEICALKWDDLNDSTGELHISRQVCTANGQLIISAPKTKSSDRVIILPPNVLGILMRYRESIDSQWMFPSPKKEDFPIDPRSVYRKMKKVLDKSFCKDIRFHDLRHTFATTALEHGMDIKTLSAIIGHISSETTLDVYSHITDAMLVNAANSIERNIGSSNVFGLRETKSDQIKKDAVEKPKQHFTATKNKVRKSGTGCLYQINDHLWEGSYSPRNEYGKRIKKNVYAKTREECEELLKDLIVTTREQIRVAKESIQARQ